MKIIQILPSLHTGGGEKFAIDLSNELSKNGNEVIICVLDKLANDLNLLKMLNPNVKVISLNKTSSFSFKTMLNLFYFIKKEKPDLIHTHLRGLIYSIFIILFTKISIIHTIHNLADKEISKKFQKIHKIFFKYFGVVPVSISPIVLESTKKLYGKEFNELVYNGVSPLQLTDKLTSVRNELESYKSSKNTKIVLNIGRIIKQKNQLMLIEAINEMVKDNHDIILLILGSKETDINYFKECLEKVKFENNIKFLGIKENVSDYIYLSDVFCLSSIYEGLPLVILETMSLGKQIVSTPAGGVVDVIKDYQNGFLTKSFDKNELKLKLLEAIKNPCNEELIIKNFNENYSMEICMRNYKNIYMRKINESN